MRLMLLHYTPRPSAVRLTTQQHLEALERLSSRGDILSYNTVHGVPTWLRRLRFDAVILHTTFLAVRWHTYFHRWKGHSAWLADLAIPKIAFPQDEYDHAEDLDEWLDDLGAEIVCTVLDGRHREQLYPRLTKKAAFYETLTGYIDEESALRFRARLSPLAERPFDIVYRARNLPYWLGSHSQLKHRIGEVVAGQAPEHGLETDISTRLHETILGDAWLDFLATGRATIGAESGSSVLDRRGEIRARVDKIVEAEPSISFEDLSARMPNGWDDYRFFAISPRHLEAVITKTAQILIEGNYSGVLEADRHFIPVRADFSNIDDALEQARDPNLLTKIADQAYSDVYESGRYDSQRLTELVETILDEHVRPSPKAAGTRTVFTLAEGVAKVESEVERRLVEPVAGVFRAGAAGYLEMLAGLRLAAVDRKTRRLLVDYLLSAETREHVGPREALADLLRLGVVRRARAGKFDGAQPFGISGHVDEGRRRVVLQSHGPMASPDAASLSRVEEALGEPGWEFYWDHSGVGEPISYPVFRRRSLELPTSSGPTRLRVLDWLARYRPRHVADAVAPTLRH
jgi:hypothetical protein